jgi:hypothetical protein
MVKLHGWMLKDQARQHPGNAVAREFKGHDWLEAKDVVVCS